jgi:hypothetical protein
MDADWTIPFVVIQRGDGIGFKRLSFESMLFRIKSGKSFAQFKVPVEDEIFLSFIVEV